MCEAKTAEWNIRQAQFFRDQHQPGQKIHAPLPRGESIDGNVPCIGFEQSADKLQQRAFASAVASQQAVDVPFAERQRDLRKPSGDGCNRKKRF